jgi:hypothetical protein
MAERDTVPLGGTLEKQDTSTRNPTDSGEIFTTAVEEEYVTGIKLVLIIASCTTAGFLMLLDTSIVATVSET